MTKCVCSCLLQSPHLANAHVRLYLAKHIRQVYTRFKHLTAEPEVPGSNSGAALIFKFLFIFDSNKKKIIEMLTKIYAKITIIMVENREPYYFITICKCKQGTLSLFSYQMLASILTMDEQSSYYKVYGLT